MKKKAKGAALSAAEKEMIRGLSKEQLMRLYEAIAKPRKGKAKL